MTPFCRCWYDYDEAGTVEMMEECPVHGSREYDKGTVTMKTATEIKRIEGFTSDARLYKLSEPIAYDFDYDTENYKSSTNFVIVSAAHVMFTGPETYIFPASEQGEVLSWSELDGSYRGGLDHERALEGAGYAV